MANNISLNALAQLVFDEKPQLETLKPVVIKELIHYEMLWALTEAGLLKDLTFHGGTALRLCYGANRLSEDLDFAGGIHFTKTDVDGISEVLKSHLTNHYGLDVTVKEPKRHKNDGATISVDTWQISVITDPGRPDMPRQRIKIDIATMTAQSRTPQAIHKNYPVITSGLEDLLVPVMSKEEILANKLVSLPASGKQRNIRHRDIWDIGWLVRNGAMLNFDMVEARAAEFHLDDYHDRIDFMLDSLPDIINGAVFRQEMSRFLPFDVVEKTINQPEFSTYLLNTVSEHLAQVKMAMESKEMLSGPETTMFRNENTDADGLSSTEKLRKIISGIIRSADEEERYGILVRENLVPKNISAQARQDDLLSDSLIGQAILLFGIKSPDERRDILVDLGIPQECDVELPARYVNTRIKN